LEKRVSFTVGQSSMLAARKGKAKQLLKPIQFFFQPYEMLLLVKVSVPVRFGYLVRYLVSPISASNST
jgi:hypothetical protein